MARGGMDQVELLEEGAPDPDLAAPAPDGADRLRGVLRRVLAWSATHRAVVAAGVGVLAVAVATPVLLGTRADRARLAWLAEHPGILRPVDPSVHAAWTSPTVPEEATDLGPGRAWLRDGVLVTWSRASESQFNLLRGIDAATGAALWTLELSPSPGPTAYVPYDATSCLAPAPGRGEGVVVCVVVDAWRPTDPDVDLDPDGDGVREPVSAEAQSQRLITVDAATGETLFGREVEDDTSFAVVDGDVVIAESPHDDVFDAEATTRVTRLDPTTGDEVWHADVPRVELVGSAFASVQVVGGDVAVSWLGATQFLSAEDGTATREPVPSDAVTSLADGHLLAFLQNEHGKEGVRLGVVDTDIEIALDGSTYPAWLSADDGSSPGLLLEGEALSLTDLTTGEVRWTDERAEDTWGSAKLVVGGRLVVPAEGEVRVIDLATGARLWSSAPPAWLHVPPVSDGRYVFLLEAGGDTGRVLAAYALTDGTRAWAAAVPSTVENLAVVDNRLFGYGFEGITAFAQDGAG